MRRIPFTVGQGVVVGCVIAAAYLMVREFLAPVLTDLTDTSFIQRRADCMEECITQAGYQAVLSGHAGAWEVSAARDACNYYCKHKEKKEEAE